MNRKSHAHLPATTVARSPVNAKPKTTRQSGQTLPNHTQEQRTTQLMTDFIKSSWATNSWNKYFSRQMPATYFNTKASAKFNIPSEAHFLCLWPLLPGGFRAELEHADNFCLFQVKWQYTGTLGYSNPPATRMESYGLLDWTRMVFHSLRSPFPKTLNVWRMEPLVSSFLPFHEIRDGSNSVIWFWLHSLNCGNSWPLYISVLFKLGQNTPHIAAESFLLSAKSDSNILKIML